MRNKNVPRTENKPKPNQNKRKTPGEINIT